ncbi:hypothetical protein DBR40_07335 [Pedobacter sp. KBW01]|uniref:RagB/SusD family nutrient uptake outer membrane protein n=1 Tax=Pedobacter sp. KBW01 TaxID=2153364 RepID=UPI000F5ACA2D|nr:RagB/SusD family nutrient uptake outer membrane protein [Pedobacter sp. KBW01]RQO77780.1 hypothetical protein DBR40_07335 [Pedobacter sp. KBW01]
MKIKKSIVLICFLLGLMGCKKDFLEVTNDSRLIRQSYVNDLKGLESFQNGIYVMLNQRFADGIEEAYPELAADNLKPREFPGLTLMYNWAQEKDDSSVLNLSNTAKNLNAVWGNGYLIIRACNFVIEQSGKYHNENPTKANNLKGQALAIRAMVFFRLVNFFAQPFSFTNAATHPGVPYITTSDITKPFVRESVGEVYDKIIEDFKSSINLLPEQTSDVRYMNRQAAEALLARAYLFKGDFKNAADLSEKVGLAVPMMSIAAGYPDAMFAKKIGAGIEVLFQATPSDAYFSHFLGEYFRGTEPNFDASQDIVEILKEDSGDARSSWIGNDMTITKFPLSIAGLRSTPSADYYQPFIRSSECFLTAAESFAKLGNEDKARDYINAVRLRANPTARRTMLSGGQLIDLIERERRKELCFEGLRLFDLRRIKKIVTRIDALPGSPKTLPYPSDKAIAPIPVQDTEIAGIQQNNGY